MVPLALAGKLHEFTDLAATVGHGCTVLGVTVVGTAPGAFLTIDGHIERIALLAVGCTPVPTAIEIYRGVAAELAATHILEHAAVIRVRTIGCPGEGDVVQRSTLDLAGYEVEGEALCLAGSGGSDALALLALGEQALGIDVILIAVATGEEDVTTTQRSRAEAEDTLPIFARDCPAVSAAEPPMVMVWGTCTTPSERGTMLETV